ncbi:MAG: Trm112 family protein [Actinomycetia bacterium]|nr:Trm112 family protein [Actinomycetes bacterium]
MTNEEPLVSAELLAIMQCPACAGELSERREKPALVCADCGRAYPIREGIPVMLVEEAEEPAS